MDDIIRRNHYDVTDSVFVADPRAVRAEVCRLLTGLYREADLRPIVTAFDVFGQLYTGTLPGYRDCETWYHDAQHSLDCCLVLARLLDGYERSVPAVERLGARRSSVGVIAALFHDAGYIRTIDDREEHGAAFTTCHVRRSGDFLAEFLPGVGFADDAPMVEQLVHFTGYEVALDRIDVPDPLDRRLGMMLGAADILAQMSDRCYPEKCRDFLYPEFEVCGLAAAPREGMPDPAYASPEDLIRRTPAFIEQIWDERMDGHFEGIHRHVAAHFGGRNPYLAAIASHRRRLADAIATDRIDGDLRRRAECINAGPLRVILGLQKPHPGIRAASRPPVAKPSPRTRGADSGNHIPT